MKKKVLSISLTIAILAVAIIGATLAYFTDKTDTETNVFTVGNIAIKLDEPNWDPGEDEQGNPLSAHILPSLVIAKDPTITVEDNSDDAYVFMDLELNKYVSFLKLVGLNEGWHEGDIWGEWNSAIQNDAYQEILDRWFTGIDHNKWDIMNETELLAELNKMATGTNANWLTIKIAYKDVQTAGDQVTLFTGMTIPASVTSEMIEVSGFNSSEMTWTMNFTAKAIQAEGIVDYNAAYAALYE